MDAARFDIITGRYPSLRIAVVGDFCLDRYLEINPDLEETSLETGLLVHNVANVRAQPGGAGTILNNLAALGIGTLRPIGFAGQDGEGYELSQALGKVPGVLLDGIVRTPQRRTFTYCKPLLIFKNRAPRELNRLDTKNWTATPEEVQEKLAARLVQVGAAVDAIIVLDQVDIAETGVVTRTTLQSVKRIAAERPGLLVLADSRRGLRGFPPFFFKMNAAELARLRASEQQKNEASEPSSKRTEQQDFESIKATASHLAKKNGRPVFVTLAEQGILAATPEGLLEHVAAHPLRGEIDIVGAGDAVSANLAAALCAGATVREALELANAAASVVIHKLGTTGTASIAELGERLFRV